MVEPGHLDVSRLRRRYVVVLGALLLWAFGYFYQAGGWNQNSRFDLVRAVVEQGSISIDAYHRNTGDKAKVDGHFYTDKAPGQSFAAVPVVAGIRPVLAMMGYDPESRRGVTALSYAATLVTAALPTVLAALLLLWLAVRLGAGRDGALFAALVFGLGTPAWAYATLFMGHGLATGCVFGGFAAAVALRSQSSGRRDVLLGLGIGLGAGWGVVTEYPAAPAALVIAALAMVHARAGGPRRMVRVGAAIGAGALVCLLVLLGYQRAAFGSMLDTPLRHLYLFENVREQPFSWPRADALAAILWGQKRGLLPLAPILVLAPVGVALLWRDRAARATVAAAAAIAVYYFLFNASFATPLAGWCYGPRYTATALPFLALPLAVVWTRAQPWMRAMMAAAGLWGAVMSLLAVATTAQPPESFARPVWQLFWPAFRAGELSLNHQSFMEVAAYPDKLRGQLLEHDAWNLGELMGLGGHASLVPLALGFIAAAIAWKWWACRS